MIITIVSFENILRSCLSFQIDMDVKQKEKEIGSSIKILRLPAKQGTIRLRSCLYLQIQRIV